MFCRRFMIPLFLGVFILVACGNSIGSPLSQSALKKAKGPVAEPIPEKYNDLMNNFKLYWSAFKDRDFEKAYGMESSTFKKKVTLDTYKENHKSAVIVIGMKPLAVKPLNEKEVIVKAGFGYKAGFVDTVRVTEDHWVKEDAGWRHLPVEGQKAISNNSVRPSAKQKNS
jgi:hypothetical protein